MNHIPDEIAHAVHSRVLVVHDEEPVARYFRDMVVSEGEFSFVVKTTHQEGIAAFQEHNFDLVITKFDPAHKDDTVFVNALKAKDPDCIIIAVLGQGVTAIPQETGALGIYGYIHTPITSEKLFFLIKKGVQLHIVASAHRRLVYSLQEQNVSLQKQNTLLAKRIDESTKNLTRLYEDLRATYMRTIKSLAEAIDARDHYTHSHSHNVALYAVAIAQQMSLSVKEIDQIRQACELHDVGKIGVEDKILSKPAALTEEEGMQVRRHPITGAQILEPLTFLHSVVELVKQHHEHFDGSGYPAGLKGDQILLGARIIHLADAYDAMVSARSYRTVPFTKPEAVYEIKKNSGTQFDPKVVEAFLKIKDTL